MAEKTEKEKTKELYQNVLNSIYSCDHLLDNALSLLASMRIKQALEELQAYHASKELLKRILEQKTREL